MKEKLINKIIKFITKNKQYNDRSIKAMRYGLEGLFNTLIKTIVVIIISLIMNTFYECLLLFLFFGILRAFSYGLHASSSIVCWITTLPTYIIGSLLIKYVDLNNIIYYIIWTSGLVATILWAPADTPKRPLIHKEKRITKKFITIIISIIYLLLIIFVNNTSIKNAIILAQLIEIISINPLSYLLTKTTFNNYKYYLKKV